MGKGSGVFSSATGYSAAACAGVRLPVTEQAAEQILTLPCFAEMTETEIERVCDVLRKL